MKKLRCLVVLILAIGVQPFLLAKVNLHEVLKQIDFNFREFSGTDFEPFDTICSKDQTYLEIRANESADFLPLLHMQAFQDKQKNILLVIAGYYSDEQCGEYKTHLVQIEPEHGTVTKPEWRERIPEVGLKDLVINPDILKGLEEILPDLRQAYLGESASLNDLLEEFYDLKIYPSGTKNQLTITLTYCDYIPTNIGLVPEDLLHKLEYQIPWMYVSWNSKTGNFELN